MEDLEQDGSLKALRNELRQDYGIHFPERKFYQLKAKIRKRLRDLELETIDQYRTYLEENPKEVSNFLDIVSTNTTRFYREPRHWDFYEDLLEGPWSDRSLKLWSAACSSGEEPYTLAMLTEDHRDGPHRGLTRSSNYKILATDLSDSALRTGMRGQYDEMAIENLQASRPTFVQRYFEPVAEDQYEVLESIKEQVTFRRFNLKTANYPYQGVFDLILIRNVLIYFDQEMTEHVVNSLANCLITGGYLFVGHSESLSSISHPLEKVQPAIYQCSE
ncbi:MAG: protein-glutamate O-methyltransferase CheR [bacterium]